MARHHFGSSQITQFSTHTGCNIPAHHTHGSWYPNHTTHRVNIPRVLHFPLLGLCPSACLAGLLTSGFHTCSHSTVSDPTLPKPHLTLLSDVIPRWDLNSCNGGPMRLQFGTQLKMCPCLTMTISFVTNKPEIL